MNDNHCKMETGSFKKLKVVCNKDAVVRTQKGMPLCVWHGNAARKANIKLYPL